MVDEDGQEPQDLEDEKVRALRLRQGRRYPVQFPSKWPSESSIPGFRSFMEAFIDNCHNAGMDVIACLEQELELPKDELVNRSTTKVDELRLNHYSPLPTEKLSDGKHQRAWTHTDFGMLTLLYQDEARGLEVRDRTKPGSFIPICHESPTEMLIYVSDTLEHLTKNYLRAGIHQVATPVGIGDRAAGMLPERCSIACFLKADRDTNVGSLERYVTAGEPKIYGDMTALELHWKRVGQLHVDAY